MSRRRLTLSMLAAVTAGLGAGLLLSAAIDDDDGGRPAGNASNASATATTTVTTGAQPTTTSTDPADDRPLLELRAPRSGDEVACPVAVRGTSNLFEATANAVVVRPRGEEPDPAVVTATAGSGTRGSFAEQIPCPPGTRPGDQLELRIWASSAEDGSRLYEVRVPLRAR